MLVCEKFGLTPQQKNSLIKKLVCRGKHKWKSGICEKCKIDVVSKDAKKVAKKIIDRHIEYWKKNKKNRPSDFETLECVNPNTTPEDFMRQKEKRKREQQEIREIIRKIKK